MSGKLVPEHVAAYAAALHHGGGGTWGWVARFVDAVGFGSYDPRVLARAAQAWARVHVAPAAIEELRRLAKDRAAGVAAALGHRRPGQAQRRYTQ